MPMTQKEWIKLLQDHGWRQEQGGKHVVKMTKEGRRPITLPMHKGQVLLEGPRRGDPKAGGAMIRAAREVAVSVSALTVRIERGEDQMYWAEVNELPGCFASGASLAELFEAIEEAVSMYLSSPTSGAVSARLTGAQFEVLQPA